MDRSVGGGRVRLTGVETLSLALVRSAVTRLEESSDAERSNDNPAEKRTDVHDEARRWHTDGQIRFEELAGITNFMMLGALEEVPSQFLFAVSRGPLHCLLELLPSVTQLNTQEHTLQLVAEEANSDSHAKNPTGRRNRGSKPLRVPMISANAAPDSVGTSASSLPRKSVMAA